MQRWNTLDTFWLESHCKQILRKSLHFVNGCCDPEAKLEMSLLCSGNVGPANIWELKFSAVSLCLDAWPVYSPYLLAWTAFKCLLWRLSPMSALSISCVFHSVSFKTGWVLMALHLECGLFCLLEWPNRPTQETESEEVSSWEGKISGFWYEQLSFLSFPSQPQ